MKDTLGAKGSKPSKVLMLEITWGQGSFSSLLRWQLRGTKATWPQGTLCCFSIPSRKGVLLLVEGMESTAGLGVNLTFQATQTARVSPVRSANHLAKEPPLREVGSLRTIIASLRYYTFPSQKSVQ